MTMSTTSPLTGLPGCGHHTFALRAALDAVDMARPHMLDFGCGIGELVALGRAQELDIVGADTFAGGYTDWHEKVVPGAAGHVYKIIDRLPFPDESFDAVISNQVFEHIEDPASVLPEIRRVMKPGAVFIALFPLRDTWYEGHVGLYFPHRLMRWPKLQRFYLRAAHTLGLGLYRGHASSRQWAEEHQRILHDMCFYHRGRDIRALWAEQFGQLPQSLNAELVAWRLDPAGTGRGWRALAHWRIMRPVLAAIGAIRAGTALKIRKTNPAARA